MRLAALVAELVAAEQAILDALAAAANTLRPGVNQLEAAYGEYAEFGMPRELTGLLDTLAGNDRQHLREEIRTRSFQRLLKEAAKVYARPGLSITISEHDVLEAVGAGGHEWRHSRQSCMVDLSAVAAYLERTYGHGAGDRVAVQQLRAYLRDQLDAEPPARTARAVTVATRVYPESYPCGAPKYDHGCRERAVAVAEALTRALALVGLPSGDHDLPQDVRRVVGGPINSRLRTACGAGVHFVTFQRKLVVELPVGAGTEFLAWLAAVETEIAA